MRDIAELSQMMREHGIRKLRVREASAEEQELELELFEYWHPSGPMPTAGPDTDTDPGTPRAKKDFQEEDIANWSADD